MHMCLSKVKLFFLYIFVIHLILPPQDFLELKIIKLIEISRRQTEDSSQLNLKMLELPSTFNGNVFWQDRL